MSQFFENSFNIVIYVHYQQCKWLLQKFVQTFQFVLYSENSHHFKQFEFLK